MKSISTSELAALGADATIIDVREADEFASARVAGAINLPLSELAGRLADIPQGGTFYVMCLSGGRSARATAFLIENGFAAVNVLGGINQWHQDGFPVMQAA
ncbi:rhodanese-like domain-containing protein [Lysinimonas soli]|uniref:Rhodanese-like domain-containing protein n=1 Tax=Lysinimonas soli TaxID=1074233 RepID=A0ABW0NUB8_9MICO